MKQYLTPNIEDYLETIVMLCKKNKVVRVKDISGTLGVSMPSVHAALHKLEDKKLVKHEKYGYIEPTQAGLDIGSEIFDAHNSIINFLVSILNVDKKTAETEACKMEHCLSRATLKKISGFVEFKEKSKSKNIVKWFDSFDGFMERKETER